MQKLTSFLEQNVQWVAVGIAALFAMWMAYAYVFQSPAKVMIGGNTFTAADIDRNTRETVATETPASRATSLMLMVMMDDRMLITISFITSAFCPSFPMVTTGLLVCSDLLPLDD